MPQVNLDLLPWGLESISSTNRNLPFRIVILFSALLCFQQAILDALRKHLIVVLATK